MRTARSRTLFLPILLIGFGILLALNNFKLYDLNLSQLYKVGIPLAIVGAGLTMMFGHARQWIGAALAVLVLVSSVVVYEINYDATVAQNEAINFPNHQAQQAKLDINLQASDLTLDVARDTEFLLEGVAPGSSAIYTLDGLAETAVVSIGSVHVEGFGFMGKPHDDVDLTVTDDVPLSVNLDLMAGDADLDFTASQLRNLDLSLDAGSLDLTLPAQSIAGSIELMAGDLKLDLPNEGVGVKIVLDSELSDIRLPDSYTQAGDTYLSPDWETSTQQIELHINIRFGDVEITN